MGASTPDDTALVARIEELVLDLTKAVRAHHLYDASNPAYARFVTSVRDGFRALWDEVEPLELLVAPERLTWRGVTVYERADHGESLAFLLHKDGVRGLRFLRGFEESEVEPFLDVLESARHVPPEGDDLVTLLWERNLSCVQYSAAELVTRGVELAEAAIDVDFDLLAVQRLALEEEHEGEKAGVGGVGDGVDDEIEGAASLEWAAAADGDDGLHPTLCVLEPAELEALEEALERERTRPLRRDVAYALLDALEVVAPEEREGLLRRLGMLLREFVAAEELAGAVEVLEDARRILAGREDVGAAGEAGTVALTPLVETLEWDALVGALARALEADRASGTDLLGRVAPFVAGGALEHLYRHAARLGSGPDADALRAVAAPLVGRPEAVRAALGTGDVTVLVEVAGALAAARTGGVADVLGQLLHHRDVDVRRAAVAALAVDPEGGPPLVEALGAEDRDVRVAAANGLAGLGHRPAAGALRSAVLDRHFRGRDLTETRAFLDAYAVLAGPRGAGTLAELLNGRGLLGPSHPPELRASAAHALSLVEGDEARRALEASAGDRETLVRHAVEQSLRAVRAR